MIPLNLSAMVRTKIDEYGDGPLRCAQIAKRLIMFALRQLRERFALDDDIAHWRVYDQVHLQIGFKRFAHEGRMELLLLLERDALGSEELGQCLLVDILRQTRPQLAIHLMEAADDIISRSDELLALGFLDGVSAS